MAHYHRNRGAARNKHDSGYSHLCGFVRIVGQKLKACYPMKTPK